MRMKNKMENKSLKSLENRIVLHEIHHLLSPLFLLSLLPPFSSFCLFSSFSSISSLCYFSYISSFSSILSYLSHLSSPLPPLSPPVCVCVCVCVYMCVCVCLSETSLRSSGWRTRWSSGTTPSSGRSLCRGSAPWRSASRGTSTAECTCAGPRTAAARPPWPASWRSNVSTGVSLAQDVQQVAP